MIESEPLVLVVGVPSRMAGRELLPQPPFAPSPPACEELDGA
jgi:hypothetical protein